MKCIVTKWLLSGGNGGNEYIGYITPTSKLGRNFFVELIKYIPPEFIKHKDKTDMKITSINGNQLQFFSAESENAVRGFQFSRLIIDEASYQTDEFFYDILLGTIAVRCLTVLMVSTPKGSNGFFYKHYIDGTINSEQNPHIKVVETSINENIYISDDNKEIIKNSVPKRVWEQEYLGMFLENGNGIFDYKDCLVDPNSFGNEVSQKDCIAGLDLGKRDRTVLTVFNKQKHMVGQWEWSNIPYTTQLEYILVKLKLYGVKTIVIESNSIGDTFIDMFKLKVSGAIKVLDFYTSNSSKNELIENLMLEFETKQIKIFKSEKLEHQLDSFGVEYNHKTRTLTYVNQRDSTGHSDYLMSLALCVWGLKTINRVGHYSYKLINNK